MLVQFCYHTWYLRTAVSRVVCFVVFTLSHVQLTCQLLILLPLLQIVLDAASGVLGVAGRVVGGAVGTGLKLAGHAAELGNYLTSHTGDDYYSDYSYGDGYSGTGGSSYSDDSSYTGGSSTNTGNSNHGGSRPSADWYYDDQAPYLDNWMNDKGVYYSDDWYDYDNYSPSSQRRPPPRSPPPHSFLPPPSFKSHPRPRSISTPPPSPPSTQSLPDDTTSPGAPTSISAPSPPSPTTWRPPAYMNPPLPPGAQSLTLPPSVRALACLFDVRINQALPHNMLLHVGCCGPATCAADTVECLRCAGVLFQSQVPVSLLQNDTSLSSFLVALTTGVSLFLHLPMDQVRNKKR